VRITSVLTSDVKPDAAKIMATTNPVPADEQPANSLTPASIAIEPAA
jgi:hypothetical protein